MKTCEINTFILLYWFSYLICFRQSESLGSISLGGPELFGQSEQSYENGQNDDIDEIISIGEDFSGIPNQCKHSRQHMKPEIIYRPLIFQTMV